MNTKSYEWGYADLNTCIIHKKPYSTECILTKTIPTFDDLILEDLYLDSEEDSLILIRNNFKTCPYCYK